MALIDNPVQEQAIRSAYRSLGINQFLIQGVRAAVYRVPGGIGANHVAVVREDVYRFAATFAPTGLSVPDVVQRNSTFETWTRVADFPSIPFTDQDVRGQTWALRLLGPALYDELLGGYTVNANIMAHALVRFDSQGQTARVETNGQLPSPIALTWTIRPDGALQLTYPNGRAQRFKIIAQASGAFGLLSELDVSGPTLYGYGDAVRLDPSLKHRTGWATLRRAGSGSPTGSAAEEGYRAYLTEPPFEGGRRPPGS